ncbi:enoyl-CoA hydratase/isomerase family protein, partial [Streptococcus pyogenes]|uniref:enoyl-CoA hydratase/isomerase family protein n=1 Tax=Streptococcus pyogenes TaxID=1314 RepID=UPI003DA02F94
LDLLEAFAISNDTASALGYLPSVDTWREFPKPTVCAVEGSVRNVALAFIEASDICVAGENATFQHDELSLGLLPSAGSTQLLPRLVGKKVATSMLFAGWPLNAAEALRYGLVSRVVPEGTAFAAASQLVGSLSSFSRPIVRELKRLVRASSELRLSDGIAEEARAFPTSFGLEDRTEGTGAALQERVPTFRHR